MLVQLPLLVLAGWCLGTSCMSLFGRARKSEWNQGGIPGLLIAITALLFWMLPKSLDGALEGIDLEVAKFITLPLCLGVPLALSWRRAHPLVRGFLKAQFLSMLGVLSFLYSAAPIRICNNYLVSEQETLGLLLGAIALLLAGLWGGALFFGEQQNDSSGAVLIPSLANQRISSHA
jgi:hypothetical protein